MWPTLRYTAHTLAVLQQQAFARDVAPLAVVVDGPWRTSKSWTATTTTTPVVVANTCQVKRIETIICFLNPSWRHGRNGRQTSHMT